jgi:DNA-directed RNA polymerase subunit A"
MEIPIAVLEAFEKKCAELGLDKAKKAAALERLKKLIAKMRYEPGEAIGIIAAQSISEPATQMTMRSYILATQRDRLSKVTQGLPRLIEIFDLRKQIEKHMKIYLMPEYNEKSAAQKFAEEIKVGTIADLIVSDSIDLVSERLEFEFEKEEDKELVANLMSKMKGIEVSWRGLKVSVKPQKGGVKALRKLRSKLLNTQVKGVKGITEVVVVREGEDWVVQTAGSNLKRILKMPQVDVARTTTNDVDQVYEVLGIEAAREVIFREVKTTLDEQGLDVDNRHLLLLADLMTSDGEVKAIGRYGISGAKSSVLARANFEETKKHLVNAAFYGETDDLRGVIENVLIGQIAPIGTGTVQLGIDVEKLAAFRGRKK